MKRWAGERGQDLVEFALVAPLLFLLLFGIIEFGVAVWRYNSVAVSAREGARAGIPYALADRVGTAQTAAHDYATGVGLDDAHLAVSAVEADSGVTRTVTVAVTYTHEGVTGILALLPGGPLTLRARSTMMLE